jgi:hypothetical protein
MPWDVLGTTRGIKMKKDQDNAGIALAHIERVDSINRRLDSRQGAAYCGLGFSTLAKMRLYGGGPRYLKIGAKVIYETRELDAWLATKRVAHTSQNAA